MKKFFISIFMVSFFALAQGATKEIEAEWNKLNWQQGPTTGKISDKATIVVPKGFVFLDEANTKKFLELTGNLPENGNYYFAPQSAKWWAVFSFNPSGYVKDDEKIDADDLLTKLKDGDAFGNEERKKLGLHELTTLGWQVVPHYDEGTKRLEWAVKLSSEGHVNVNFTTRLLGRTGVMSATLVGDTDTLTADSAEFRNRLKDFSYNSGESYTEFKSGDKVAEYGLAALVLGGAAAVATKKGFWGVLAGLFAAFWKVIAGVAVAAAAGLGSIFKKKKE
jgi:uncharacterized membrane-anchored protein